MRMVAEAAGVSTGMLNHYFANRMEMLEETLLFVSQRQQEREAKAIDGVHAGEDRLRALVRSVLPTDQDSTEAWRVWIAAHGASVRLTHLRKVMGSRNDLWFEILERALEGIVPKDPRAKVPYSWQLDALMNGLIIQAITSEANISFKDIEHVVVNAALEHGSVVSRNGKAPAAKPRGRSRAAAAK
jgi:AcrR family transcriptional regulator